MRILASQRDAISALRFWTDGRMATFDFFQKKKRKKAKLPGPELLLAWQLSWAIARVGQSTSIRVLARFNNYATTSLKKTIMLLLNH